MRRRFKKMIGQAALAILRFSPSGARPEPRRYVLIAAPHTSNWDLPVTLALALYYDIPMRFMGKASLFRPPFGWFFRAVGGIPVVRSAQRNLVQQMTDLFAECGELALVVPTEATRARAEYWRSGFYHIASSAEVPIVLGFIDFERRQGGFGPAIQPSADKRADMERIRTFYADKRGKYPELFGPIRLKDEGTRPPR